MGDKPKGAGGPFGKGGGWSFSGQFGEYALGGGAKSGKKVCEMLVT